LGTASHLVLRDRRRIEPLPLAARTERSSNAWRSGRGSAGDEMILATIVLVSSLALFLFYLQATCQNILRREFASEYFKSIVNANRLEFLYVRRALEAFDTPVDYPWVRLALKCDYLALTYLLKNAANAKRTYSWQERLLMGYFKSLLLLLSIFHILQFSERTLIFKLTSILQHFANILGERVSQIRFGNLSASEYLMSL
jgi:hypothetical protein